MSIYNLLKSIIRILRSTTRQDNNILLQQSQLYIMLNTTIEKKIAIKIDKLQLYNKKTNYIYISRQQYWKDYY